MPVSIKYADDSQADGAVQAAATEVERILTPNEEIQYVAVQGGPLSIGQKKDAAVATNNRLLIVRRHLLGQMDIADFQWQDVANVSLKQGMTSSDIVVTHVDGKVATLDTVDKAMAQRFYGISQQMEQEWREKRRVRTMEEERARAGGIVMSMPGAATGPVVAASGGDDQVERLAKAKSMLDQGLISEAEYDSLKAKILESI